MKRVFGAFEAIFDLIYLVTALILGLYLIFSDSGNLIKTLAGIMAIVLVSGDAFHLIPRIAVIRTANEKTYRKPLGRGKQIASITMTIFYIFLWHIGLSIYSQDNISLWSIVIYLLAGIRILLCLLAHNKWEERFPPVKWGILRNIPFFLQGIGMESALQKQLAYPWIRLRSLQSLTMRD